MVVLRWGAFFNERGTPEQVRFRRHASRWAKQVPNMRLLYHSAEGSKTLWDLC